MKEKRKNKAGKLIFIIIIILIAIFLIYGIFRLTGLVISGNDVKITRTVTNIEKGENESLFSVVLSLEVKEGNKALAIHEKMTMSSCSEIYNISDNGIEKYGNVIEWFFADSGLGLNVSNIENKNLSYMVRIEKC